MKTKTKNQITNLLKSSTIKTSAFLSGIVIGAFAITAFATQGGDFKTANNASTGTLLSTGLWNNIVDQVGNSVDNISTNTSDILSVSGSLSTLSDKFGNLTNKYFPVFDGTKLIDSVIVQSGGNVGIGTTSPQMKAEVNGSLRITGISSAPIAGTGMELGYSGGVGYIQVVDRTSGTPKNLSLLVDGGNVGIGTINPSGKLHIEGGSGLVVTNSSSSSYYQGWNGGVVAAVGPALAEVALISTREGGASWGFVSEGTSYGSLDLLVNTGANAKPTTSVMTFKADTKNVGIGTTSPSSLLHLKFATDKNLKFVPASDLGGTTGVGLLSQLDSTANAPLILYGSNIIMSPQGNGVGIGTTSPLEKFHITDSNIVTGHGMIHVDSLPSAGGYGTYFSGKMTNSTSNVVDGGALIFKIVNNTAGSETSEVHFATRNAGGSMSEKMVINSIGNVGIGTTNPQSKLQIGDASSSSTDFLQIDNGGIPSSSDCDQDSETGRIYLNAPNSRLYVCNSATGRGWDYISLND